MNILPLDQCQAAINVWDKLNKKQQEQAKLAMTHWKHLYSSTAPVFHYLLNYMQYDRYTHYWLAGGRGSLKSSTAALSIISGMQTNPGRNCVALRKVKDTLKDSVYMQLCWAIEKLGKADKWEKTISPLSLTYTPTGQKILFRGSDDPVKIKSIKFDKGYCGYVWYEELDEFSGMDEIRKINQSLLRGGDKFTVVYTYNPPKSVKNWVNSEALVKSDDKIFHQSSYLDAPSEWLGEQFITEANHLKETKPNAYEHEYLGSVNGTGGEIFDNICIREISDEEIETFENVRRGLDFGYAVDPLSYGVMNYDRKKKDLYIYFEIYKVGMSNYALAQEIKKENVLNQLVTADSAEPKSISELNQLGLRVAGVKKGPDSIDYGIKFLQSLEHIYIDDKRCPNTAREFLNYELERDSRGEFKAGYPDKDNHSIDMVRYALREDSLNHTVKAEQPKKTYNFDFERKKESKSNLMTGGEITNSYINYWG